MTDSQLIAILHEVAGSLDREPTELERLGMREAIDLAIERIEGLTERAERAEAILDRIDALAAEAIPEERGDPAACPPGHLSRVGALASASARGPEPTPGAIVAIWYLAQAGAVREGSEREVNRDEATREPRLGAYRVRRPGGAWMLAELCHCPDEGTLEWWFIATDEHEALSGSDLEYEFLAPIRGDFCGDRWCKTCARPDDDEGLDDEDGATISNPENPEPACTCDSEEDAETIVARIRDKVPERVARVERILAPRSDADRWTADASLGEESGAKVEEEIAPDPSERAGLQKQLEYAERLCLCESHPRRDSGYYRYVCPRCSMTLDVTESVDRGLATWEGCGAPRLTDAGREELRRLRDGS